MRQGNNAPLPVVIIRGEWLADRVPELETPHGIKVEFKTAFSRVGELCPDGQCRRQPAEENSFCVCASHI
jgi:hypothetical protein